MEFVVGLALVALIVWFAWRKASESKQAQDEVQLLQQTVKGQEAALKLKREQERLRVQKEAEIELQIAEKIRRARDARAAAGFLRGDVQSDPAPGLDPVPGAGAKTKPKP